MTHAHTIPDHDHDGLTHSHGGRWDHDHDGADDGHAHDPWQMIEQPADHDHGPLPDCGHLGGGEGDPGTVRVVITHNGASHLLCGPCGNAFDWDAE